MKQFKKIIIINSQSGNALISTLFFAAISIMITSAAIIMLSVNMLSSSKTQLSTQALAAAETGAENAVLRLLRNPSYTGEVLNYLDGAMAIATVSGSGPYVIQSKGSIGNYTRSIEVQVGYQNNILSITSWKEITP